MSDAYKSTCHSHSTYKLFAIVVVGTSLVAQTVKNQPAMWETSVRSQSWEDPLEESMATYSSTLAWTIPMDRGVQQTTALGVMKSQT